MILLLYSVDPQMARHIADKSIRKDFPVKDECNYVSLNMAVTPVNELAEECSFLPLGTERKCVLASNCLFLAKSKTKYKYASGDGPEKLLEYCRNPNAFIDLYLLCPAESVDEKNEIVKAIATTGSVKGIPLPKPAEWIEYAKKYCSAKGSPIDYEAAQELVFRVDNDYGRFLNEMDKLLAYANGEPITKAIVTRMVPPKEEDDIFQMSNALARNDVSKAFAVYKDLKAHSMDEIRIINILTNQFVFMDEVRFLSARGSSAMDIAQELGANPKRVEITMRGLYQVKSDGITKILEELYKTEKSILSGEADPSFAFTRFLANYKI